MDQKGPMKGIQRFLTSGRELYNYLRAIHFNSNIPILIELSEELVFLGSQENK
jgi:hypothetical protein